MAQASLPCGRCERSKPSAPRPPPPAPRAALSRPHPLQPFHAFSCCRATLFSHAAPVLLFDRAVPHSRPASHPPERLCHVPFCGSSQHLRTAAALRHRVHCSAGVVVASVPSWLRLFQCLRAYISEPERKHLLNALKYSTAFPVLVFSYLKQNSGDLTAAQQRLLGHLWLLSLVANSLYSFYWDVYYDWGLGSLSSSNFFLRYGARHTARGMCSRHATGRRSGELFAGRAQAPPAREVVRLSTRPAINAGRRGPGWSLELAQARATFRRRRFQIKLQQPPAHACHSRRPRNLHNARTARSFFSEQSPPHHPRHDQAAAKHVFNSTGVACHPLAPAHSPCPPHDTLTEPSRHNSALPRRSNIGNIWQNRSFRPPILPHTSLLPFICDDLRSDFIRHPPTPKTGGWATSAPTPLQSRADCWWQGLRGWWRWCRSAKHQYQWQQHHHTHEQQHLRCQC